MRAFRYGLMAGGVALLLWTGSGCVSQSKYDDCVSRNRTQQEKIDQFQAELNKERDRADRLQQQLDLQKLTGPQLLQKITALEALLAEKQKLIDQLSEQVGKFALPPELSNALADWARQVGSDLVTFDEKTGIVRFKSDLLFDLGSDVLAQNVLSSLQKLAGIMNSESAKAFDLIIVGHTDDVPISKPETRKLHPTNWHLSAHRAISVEVLMAKSGLAETRLAVMGMGEFRPIEANAAGKKGNVKNRRVEIYIVPAGQVHISMKSAPISK